MSASLSDSQSLLKKALKDLDSRWMHTASEWNDKAREEFDKQHLEPLRIAVMNAGHSMNNIDMVLRKVISDCR